jgi:hypothetical protein
MDALNCPADCIWRGRSVRLALRVPPPTVCATADNHDTDGPAAAYSHDTGLTVASDLLIIRAPAWG